MNLNEENLQRSILEIWQETKRQDEGDGVRVIFLTPENCAEELRAENLKNQKTAREMKKQRNRYARENKILWAENRDMRELLKFDKMVQELDVAEDLPLKNIDSIEKRINQIAEIKKAADYQLSRLQVRKAKVLKTLDHKIRYELIYTEGKTYISDKCILRFYIEHNGVKCKVLDINFYGQEEITDFILSDVPDKYKDDIRCLHLLALEEYREHEEKRKQQDQEDMRKRIFGDDYKNYNYSSSQKQDVPKDKARKIFREMEKLFHPDNNGDAEMFAALMAMKSNMGF